MNVAVVLITLALLGVVIAVVGSPLQHHRRRRAASPGELRRGELEAAREAKYREIRDAELDFRLGKLSEDDHAAVAGGLRAEAAAILQELDGLEASAPREPASEPEPEPAAAPAEVTEAAAAAGGPAPADPEADADEAEDDLLAGPAEREPSELRGGGW